MVARTRAARRLAAGQTLPTLPDELIQAVAHALCSAEGRAAMLRTCKAWQHAIEADPHLWEAIALRCFPSLAQLALHLPGTSWPELYRAQLEAVSRPPPTVATECKTTLDDYLITYELLRSGEELFSWTGPPSAFEDAEWEGVAIELWPEDEVPAAIQAPDFVWDQVQLRAFATRRIAGTPLRMVQLFDLPVDDADQDMVCFDLPHGPAPMPCKGRYLTHLFTDILGDDDQLKLIARPWLNLATRALTSVFRLDTADDYLEMNREHIRFYLEHCVPWGE